MTYVLTGYLAPYGAAMAIDRVELRGKIDNRIAFSLAPAPARKRSQGSDKRFLVRCNLPMGEDQPLRLPPGL